VAITSPRPFLDEKMPPNWSNRSLPDPIAPEDRTNMNMTTMVSTARTDLPVRLRTLNVWNGLKAMSGPRFTTAVLGGGGVPGLTLRAGKYYLDGNAGRTRMVNCSDAGGVD
jgi:hypothetical protein